LKEAREQYEKQRQSDRCTLTQEQKAQILALAEDFPRLWKDPATSDRDRKRTARLILEDVTLTREGTLITAQVRFKGGATRVLSVTAPPAAPQMRKTKTHIIAEIDRLLEECTNSQIAAELNKKGWRSSDNRPFSARIIQQLICNHKLPDRAERLCAKGLQSTRQIAQLIDSKPNLVDYWRERGLLNGVPFNDKNEYLYERPAPELVQHIKRRTRLKRNLS
jgi:hypothetical protein